MRFLPWALTIGMSVAASTVCSSAAAQATPGFGPPPPPHLQAPPDLVGWRGPITGPEKMDYDEEKPIPYGYHLEEERRLGLSVTGGVLLGAGAVSSAILGGVLMNECTGAFIFDTCEVRREYGYGMIPLAGPFVVLGTTGTHDIGAMMGFTILGLTQVAGLSLVIAGEAAPAEVLVRDDIEVSVSASPGGLALNGSF